MAKPISTYEKTKKKWAKCLKQKIKLQEMVDRREFIKLKLATYHKEQKKLSPNILVEQRKLFNMMDETEW